jgi:hypothetical protein
MPLNLLKKGDRAKYKCRPGYLGKMPVEDTARHGRRPAVCGKKIKVYK